MSRSTGFRRLVLGVSVAGSAMVAAATDTEAAPYCPPGNNSPICTCGKAKCDPPTPAVKYGSQTWGPAYYVLSVLYAPPGNASSAAFGNSTTEGTTTGVSTGISVGQSISLTASGGFLGTQTTLGVTVSNSAGSSKSTTVTTTATSTTGAQLTSTKDVIDHDQDRFFLWLNPQLTVTQTGASAGSYSLGTANGEPMDVIDVSLAELKNPSLIPASKMGTQVIHGAALPGLAGLKPSDFAAIAAMDPLASATAAPADTNRYVYVESLPLEGPDNDGVGAVKGTFNISDGMATAKTKTETVQATSTFTVGQKTGFPGFFDLQLNYSQSLTWNHMTSAGTSSGTGTQASVTLGTSKVGCREYVDVYSDTLFHTMAFVTPRPSCAPLGLQTVAQAEALRGVLLSAVGQPQPHQIVTLTLPNGTVRRVVTDSKGQYALDSAPAGTVKINALGLAAQAKVVPGQAVEAPALKRATIPVLKPVSKPVSPVLKPTNPALQPR